MSLHSRIILEKPQNRPLCTNPAQCEMISV